LGESRFEEEIARMQALTARQLMTAELNTVAMDASLEEISSMMSDSHVHFVPVLDDGAVVGVISRHHVIRELAKHLK
jgi:predicted transcriptional regulator